MAKRVRAALYLSYICESLRPLAVAISDLVPDAANANKHSKKSVATIKASLVQFGQLKPIVVQREGLVIRAGNGTYSAALELGWTHIAAVMVDHDNVQAIAFAIADNRTAELSEWDPEALKKLMPEIAVGESDLQQMFADLATELDLYAATEEADPEPEIEPEPSQDPVPERFKVLVTCSDESAQAELLERLQLEGFECRSFSE